MQNNNALIAIAAAATALAAAATALVSGQPCSQAESANQKSEDTTEVIPPTTTRKRGRPSASTEATADTEAAATPEPEKKETGKTLEQLRALIEPLVKGGQGDEVKKVIAKYAPKLSEIAPKDHDAFTKDIEALSL